MISFKNRLVFTCIHKSIKNIYSKSFRTIGSVSTWNDGDANFPEEPVVQSLDNNHTDNNHTHNNHTNNNNHSNNNHTNNNHTNNNNHSTIHELGRVLPRTNEEFRDLQSQSSESPADSMALTVAVIGMPNGGKSTLVNRLVGSRISSVSKRVHTTRRNIVGVMQEQNVQVVFLDTPGLVTSAHCHRHSLEQTFLSHPTQGSRVADLILVVVDASNKRERERLNQGVIHQLRTNHKPSALVINKVDSVGSKRRLIDISTRLSEGHIDGRPFSLLRIEDFTPPTAVQEHRRLNNIERRVRRKGHIVDIEDIVNTEDEPEGVDCVGWKKFDRVFMVSALDGDGVDDLREYLVSKAVRREWRFHPSVITPLSPSQIVYNAVREKLLDYLPQEIPYLLSLHIQSWDLTPTGTLAISLDLFTPKARHLPIILGPGGRTIGIIASQLRAALCDAFNTDVVVKLNLKDRDRNSQVRKKVTETQVKKKVTETQVKKKATETLR